MSEQAGPVSPLRQRLVEDFTKLVHQSSKPIRTPTKWKASAEGLAETKRSRFLAPDEDVGDWVLAPRADDVPSILEELEPPVDLLIRQNQSPGDILMLTAAIRDLHQSYPGKFRTDVMITSVKLLQLFENNPYITKLERNAPTTNVLQAHYPLHQYSNQLPYHFIHGFRKDIERKLGLPIAAGEFRPDVHLTEEEMVCPIPELADKPFWIVNAGCKSDYTNKLWEIDRFQQVVDRYPDSTFVQVGANAPDHIHKSLKNVVDLVGKTSIRDMCKLMYHAFGVITPVSFAMHLSAAIDMHPRYCKRVITNNRRVNRPCIVLAGGREPVHWEAYPTHAFLHSCGQLDCCLHGGCWRSRIVKLGDGDAKDNSLCFKPVECPSGQIIPRCMDRIDVDRVCEEIDNYEFAFGL